MASSTKSPIPRESANFSASVPPDTSAKIDLLISLQLWAWSALTLALQNSWGGPQSNDKRDWLAGAVSELLAIGQVVDAEDLEEVLIQVMLDEFEVVVDDGSPAEVATNIIRGRQAILQGDHSEIDGMFARWQENQKKGQGKVIFKRVEEGDEEEQDTDWESSDEEIAQIDTEMNEAPTLVPLHKPEKLKPEMDEDGFTKVLGKSKR